MILAILMLLIAGIIYYSTHKIPPDPLFQQEVYVDERDFWDDMTEEGFEEDKPLNPLLQVVEAHERIVLTNPPKLGNYQRFRKQEKEVEKRRKKRRIAKKSRQQNRTK